MAQGLAGDKVVSRAPQGNETPKMIILLPSPCVHTEEMQLQTECGTQYYESGQSGVPSSHQPVSGTPN